MSLIEPPPTPWEFPDPRDSPDDLVCAGADLEPGTLLRAYRSGFFPMPIGQRRRQLGWFSPDPRGIIPMEPGGLRVSRSLRSSMKRFTVTFDASFAETMVRCGDPKRPNGWINRDFVHAYNELHRLGWAHSIEVRDPLTGQMVGGLYGVLTGGLFAGESMFHAVTDASKVAMVHTVDWLRSVGVTLFDVQWTTPHLVSMGAVDISRPAYLARLAEAVQ